MKLYILLAIRIYKILTLPLYAALTPYSGCRYWPTCSQYAYRAIEKYGVGKGSLMSLKRIARCNPFCEGGRDELNN